MVLEENLEDFSSLLVEWSSMADSRRVAGIRVGEKPLDKVVSGFGKLEMYEV